MATILTDDIFKWIKVSWMNMVKIPIQISLEFIPKNPNEIKPVSVQVMAWRRTGDKPFPEPMMSQFTDAYKPH